MTVQVSSDWDPLISQTVFDGQSPEGSTFVCGQNQPNPSNYSKKTHIKDVITQVVILHKSQINTNDCTSQ